jgi:hypothetical protein
MRVGGKPLLVDGVTTTIFRWSDGTRTAMTIARNLNPQSDGAISSNLKWNEHLFALNSIGLEEHIGRDGQRGPGDPPMAYQGRPTAQPRRTGRG